MCVLLLLAASPAAALDVGGSSWRVFPVGESEPSTEADVVEGRMWLARNPDASPRVYFAGGHRGGTLAGEAGVRVEAVLGVWVDCDRDAAIMLSESPLGSLDEFSPCLDDANYWGSVREPRPFGGAGGEAPVTFRELRALGPGGDVHSMSTRVFAMPAAYVGASHAYEELTFDPTLRLWTGKALWPPTAEAHFFAFVPDADVHGFALPKVGLGVTPGGLQYHLRDVDQLEVGEWT